MWYGAKLYHHSRHGCTDLVFEQIEFIWSFSMLRKAMTATLVVLLLILGVVLSFALSEEPRVEANHETATATQTGTPTNTSNPTRTATRTPTITPTPTSTVVPNTQIFDIHLKWGDTQNPTLSMSARPDQEVLFREYSREAHPTEFITSVVRLNREISYGTERSVFQVTGIDLVETQLDYSLSSYWSPDSCSLAPDFILVHRDGRTLVHIVNTSQKTYYVDKVSYDTNDYSSVTLQALDATSLSGTTDGAIYVSSESGDSCEALWFRFPGKAWSPNPTPTATVTPTNTASPTATPTSTPTQTPTVPAGAYIYSLEPNLIKPGDTMTITGHAILSYPWLQSSVYLSRIGHYKLITSTYSTVITNSVQVARFTLPGDLLPGKWYVGIPGGLNDLELQVVTPTPAPSPTATKHGIFLPMMGRSSKSAW